MKRIIKNFLKHRYRSLFQLGQKIGLNILPNHFYSNIPDIKYWKAGFVTGEGCFFIKTSKSKTHKVDISVTLNFLVTQNIRDAYLLESFVKFLVVVLSL